MRFRDRRHKVLESAIFNTELSYGERLLMVLVTTIKPEYVDGHRRHGSKAMGPDGKFSLHLDYLATALGTSTAGVKKFRQGLQKAGHLTAVHEGTFGRPATWQAQVVRGYKNGGLTGSQKVPPYGLAEWLVRGYENDPLVYRTGGQPDHAPKSAVPGREPNGFTDGSNEESQPASFASSTAVCQWHRDDNCPPDCANAPAPDLDRRRSA